MDDQKDKLEEIRRLCCERSGSEITLDELKEFDDYIIWWICAY